jgi:protocatechuate 3,4-dioxygenase, beta subunit
MTNPFTPSRRRFLNTMAVFSTALWAPGAFAEELMRTPAQTEGPFYPDKLPLDTDNDLIIVNDALDASVGQIAHLTGRILDAKGNPLKNTVIEIWQCDANGAYLHSKTGNKEKQDKNFQGFGRFLTGSSGEYYFRTIKPVPYPGRTPHIHVKVKQRNKELLTTQCYVKGHEGNMKDGVLKGIKDAKVLESIMVDYRPVEGSKVGEVQGKFDIVLGFTPEA